MVLSIVYAVSLAPVGPGTPPFGQNHGGLCVDGVRGEGTVLTCIMNLFPLGPPSVGNMTQSDLDLDQLLGLK